MITESALVALAGLVAIVALLFLLITRFKWHVFLSLLVPIVLFALIPGIDRQTFIDAFEQGFGRTIQSIAVVIVLGSVLAEALKHTGGIERITASMIRWVGQKRMPLALTLSGFVIGLAIFSDVGYVILNPLVHSAAISSGLNMSVMATGLVGAMQLTHAMVPPTPGPLAAVALVGADIGQVILYGGIATLIALARRLALRAGRRAVHRIAAVRRVRGPVVHRAGARGGAAGDLAGLRADSHTARPDCGTERDRVRTAGRAHRQPGHALPGLAGGGAGHRHSHRLQQHEARSGRGPHEQVDRGGAAGLGHDHHGDRARRLPQPDPARHPPPWTPSPRRWLRPGCRPSSCRSCSA